METFEEHGKIEFNEKFMNKVFNFFIINNKKFRLKNIFGQFQ